MEAITAAGVVAAPRAVGRRVAIVDMMVGEEEGGSGVDVGTRGGRAARRGRYLLMIIFSEEAGRRTSLRYLSWQQRRGKLSGQVRKVGGRVGSTYLRHV